MNIEFKFWDFLLILVVSLQATIFAYIYEPKWKAFILTLPIPFTVASLAVGQPIDSTNVLGLLLLLIFTNVVRLLHQRLGLPIISVIILGVVGYCIIGWTIVGLLPTNGHIFWISCIAIFILAISLLKIFPYRVEEGHRSPLPIWIKLPVIITVVFILVLIKNELRGFMTVFPMVGIIAVYEARHSLWTICRQIPIIMLTILPMMLVCRITQNIIGLGPSLVFGWVVFLILLPLIYSLRAISQKEVK